MVISVLVVYDLYLLRETSFLKRLLYTKVQFQNLSNNVFWSRGPVSQKSVLFKGQTKGCNTLTDAGLNPGHSIRWKEKSYLHHLWAIMEISLGSRTRKSLLVTFVG